MKSYFSRSLYNTLSRSDVKPQSTPSLSHSDLIGVSRSNKIASLFNLDIRVKPEYDNIVTNALSKPDNDSLCAGRSMVEMLGVLAIIGVLSVGAIAGYSKAMFKYKLNKQAEQLNQVVNSVIKYVRVMDSYKSMQNLTPLFVKLGEIPQEMIKPNIQNYFYDIFNNKMYIYNEVGSSNNKNWHALVMYVNLPLLSNSNNSLEICRNVLTVAKENSANINSVYTTSGSGTDDNRKFYFEGDKRCTDTSVCLRNMTLDSIYEACTKHLGNRDATLKFEFK